MRNLKANTIMEWTILAGIISLVFIAMSTYAKRGLQGRIRDMSDFFIGSEHAADANPTAIITSNVVNTSSASTTSDISFGGEMAFEVSEDRQITAINKVIDDLKDQNPQKFVPQEAGNIEVPPPPDPGQISTEADQTEEVVDFKTQSRENQVKIRLDEAAKLEEKADEMDANAAKLREQASDIDCDGDDDCEDGRDRMRQEAGAMNVQAEELRKEAEAKRAEAAEIQKEIDQLEGGQ